MEGRVWGMGDGMGWRWDAIGWRGWDGMEEMVWDGAERTGREEEEPSFLMPQLYGDESRQLGGACPGPRRTSTRPT